MPYWACLRGLVALGIRTLWWPLPSQPLPLTPAAALPYGVVLGEIEGGTALCLEEPRVPLSSWIVDRGATPRLLKRFWILIPYGSFDDFLVVGLRRSLLALDDLEATVKHAVLGGVNASHPIADLAPADDQFARLGTPVWNHGRNRSLSDLQKGSLFIARTIYCL